MSKKLPRIRVDFYLSGDVFDIEKITKAMGLMPTFTRKKEDCPVAITALTCWKVSTKDSKCRAVSGKMREMIELLETKEGVINDLCSRYELQTSFTVVVEMKKGDVVLYGKYAGTELELEGEKYLIMRQSDILAIV